MWDINNSRVGIDMRLYSYVVVTDSGLAPNPWHGYLTIALCTPNHGSYNIGIGDWIIGNGSKSAVHRLIYAMRVTERLHFDDYYRDSRFQLKKPRFDSGDWRDAVGDNIYFQENDKWRQAETRFHCNKADMDQDTTYPYVYISNHYYYFGIQAVNVPEQYRALLRKGYQGCKSDHDPSVVMQFLEWLEKNHEPGHNERRPMHGKAAAYEVRFGKPPRMG